jgi:hypothetical protein
VTVTAGSFDVIPIIQDGTGVRIAAVTLAGVSTAHDATDTDNGRMYGVITPEEPGYRLDVYSSIDQTPGSMLASGAVDTVDKGFVLQSAGESGVTGRARLTGSGAQIAPAILLVSFALDVDVMKSAEQLATMPGYDPVYGLAAFHASAMRQMMLSDLPSAVPGLFAGLKQSPFVPLRGTEYPDLTKLESPDALREAQAALVKAMSAEELEHTAEFADMASAARERYTSLIATIRESNQPPQAAASAATPPPTATAGSLIVFGEMARG